MLHIREKQMKKLTSSVHAQKGDRVWLKQPTHSEYVWGWNVVEVLSHLLLHKTVKNYNTILMSQMLVTDKFPPSGTELCEKPTRAPLVKNSPRFMKFNGLLVCSQELTTVPMLSQMNLVHEAPFYLCKIHFNIIFPPMLKYSLQSLSFRFPYQNFMFIYLVPHKSHMPHLSHPNNSGTDYKSQRT